MRQRLALVLAVFLTLAAAPATGPANGQLQSLIARLGDEDPARREEASRQLLAMGQAARAALLQATQSDFPEVASRAAELLRQLPWFRPDDPPDIRRLLGRYGQLDDPGRISVAAAIARLASPQASGVLIRLLEEETSETVRWAMAGLLLLTDRRQLPSGALAEVDPASTRSVPLLAVAGSACLLRDPRRAELLLSRAVELMGSSPPQPAVTDRVYQSLTSLYLRDSRYDAAAQLQRRRAAGDGADTGVLSAPLRELFAIHARFGPQGGFADDLREHWASLYHPELLYCLARVFEHEGHRRLASTADWLAFAAGGLSQSAHYAAGDFLARNNWVSPARWELLAVLVLAGENKDLLDGNAHFRLGNLYAVAGEDVASAEHFRLGLEALDRCNAALMGGTRQEVEAEMHWRYIRAAVSGRSKEPTAPHLDRLLELAPARPSIALEMVPLLRQLGRAADAQRLFSAPYADLRRRLAADKDNPVLKNELAWLCARCDQRLGEALELANAAVAADPDNAAYLDTAAEANFRLGRRDEAIRLETRAISLRPDDTFMREQLKRFRGGK